MANDLTEEECCCHCNGVPVPFCLSHFSPASTALKVKNSTLHLTYGFQRFKLKSEKSRQLSQSGLEVAKDIGARVLSCNKRLGMKLAGGESSRERSGTVMMWRER